MTHEALASESLEEQRLVFITELVPEIVEVVVVWTPDNVRQLVEKRIHNLLNREELPRVMVVAQSDENPLRPVDVQA